MWRRDRPLLMTIKDMECREHSIPVWGYLEMSDPEIVGHSLEERMERQDHSCLDVIPRPGAEGASRQIFPLVSSRLD